MSRFRILSLDGGGIKGTFTAAFLAELEIMTGKRIIDYFDLITGTSTGGILAIGLGMGISAKELLEFYEKKGPDIFPNVGFHVRARNCTRWIYRPKYSAEILHRSIQSVLGNRHFGESKRMLVIPSFNANNGEIYIFKTAHHERFKQDYKEKAVDVALATSAAPTYFRAFMHKNGSAFIDGGVWANTPIVVGIVEAISILNINIYDIEVLSIGTTDSPFFVDKWKRSAGLAIWNKNIIDILMQAQTSYAVSQAKIMLDKKFLRINEITKPGRFSIDNSNNISELISLGITQARKCESEISTRFLNITAEPFNPVYYLNKN
jgi:patatin-like phospholipase/acyl hydrolase